MYIDRQGVSKKNLMSESYEWKISNADRFRRNKINNYVESNVFLLRGHWWAARFYPFKNENNDGVSIKLFCLTGDVSGQLSIWLQDQEIRFNIAAARAMMDGQVWIPIARR